MGTSWSVRRSSNVSPWEVYAAKQTSATGKVKDSWAWAGEIPESDADPQTQPPSATRVGVPPPGKTQSWDVIRRIASDGPLNHDHKTQTTSNGQIREAPPGPGTSERQGKIRRTYGYRRLVRYHNVWTPSTTIIEETPPVSKKTRRENLKVRNRGSFKLFTRDHDAAEAPQTEPSNQVAQSARVLFFGGLTPGTSVSHVINAIRKLADDRVITWHTARVNDANLRPDGSVRVSFFYTEGALEVYHLAKIGGVKIAGPTGSGVVPKVRVSRETVMTEDIREGGGRLGGFDPKLYRKFVEETVDKEKLVRRTHLNYNRELPTYTDNEVALRQVTVLPGHDPDVPPQERAQERATQSDKTGRGTPHMHNEQASQEGLLDKVKRYLGQEP